MRAAQRISLLFLGRGYNAADRDDGFSEPRRTMKDTEQAVAYRLFLLARCRWPPWPSGIPFRTGIQAVGQYLVPTAIPRAVKK